jgi:glyoxylase-like metal-dependent hydrolase (beta-lactamase superfamily II)
MTQLTRRKLFATAAAAGAVSAVVPFGHTAHAAAPVAGKQNAGWYRYKVGSIEVTVVTDGMSTSPLSDKYVANAKLDDVNKALASLHLAEGKVSHAYTPIVVNTGSKLVAMDTGLGLGMYAKSKGAVGQYHHNLEAAGIDRNAVDVVIISHFHGDHINGLVGADNKPAFPNAEVMVPETEWAFWADEKNTPRLPEIARPQMGNVKRVFGALGNKVTKYQGGKEIVPGITTIATPGHTPGHHSFVVASGNSKVLVQVDVTAGAASLFAQHPEWSLAFDTDKAQAVQTRRKLYDMAAADKMMVQGYHFAFPSMAYIEKSGNGYRLVPVPWMPSI